MGIEEIGKRRKEPLTGGKTESAKGNLKKTSVIINRNLIFTSCLKGLWLSGAFIHKDKRYIGNFMVHY